MARLKGCGRPVAGLAGVSACCAWALPGAGRGRVGAGLLVAGRFFTRSQNKIYVQYQHKSLCYYRQLALTFTLCHAFLVVENRWLQEFLRETKNFMDNQQKRFLTVTEAARYLSIRNQSLDHWRRGGKGPRFYKIGGQVRYSIQGLEEFIAACERPGGMGNKAA